MFEVAPKRDFWSVTRVWRKGRKMEWSFVCHVQAFDSAGATRAAREQMGASGKLVARRIGRQGYIEALRRAGMKVE
jgi:hypothetical protein